MLLRGLCVSTHIEAGTDDSAHIKLVHASHGYDSKSLFRRSGKAKLANANNFLLVEDVWKAACVSPLQHNSSSDSKVRTSAAAAQRLPLDAGGSKENKENSGNKVRTPDGQEEHVPKKQRTQRQNVKSDALKIVAELLQSSCKSSSAGIKPEYNPLKNMAHSAVKARFQRERERKREIGRERERKRERERERERESFSSNILEALCVFAKLTSSSLSRPTPRLTRARCCRSTSSSFRHHCSCSCFCRPCNHCHRSGPGRLGRGTQQQPPAQQLLWLQQQPPRVVHA